MQSTPPNWMQVWLEAQQGTLNEWFKSIGEVSGKAPTPDLAAGQSSPAFAPRMGIPLPNHQLFELLQRMFTLPGTEGGMSHGNVPAVGPMREHQELLQALAAAVLEHQQVLARFMAIAAEVHRDTLDLVARRAQELASSGSAPRDGAALHALWVECGEQVYAGVARSDSYSRLQGQLANTATRVRAGQQQLIEYALKQWDLPTRAELNTVHQQLLALRRQMDALTAEKPGRTSQKRSPGARAASSRSRSTR